MYIIQLNNTMYQFNLFIDECLYVWKSVIYSVQYSRKQRCDPYNFVQIRKFSGWFPYLYLQNKFLKIYHQIKLWLNSNNFQLTILIWRLFIYLNQILFFNKILLSSSPHELEPATVGIRVNCTMCCVYGSTRIFLIAKYGVKLLINYSSIVGHNRR